MKDKAKFTYDVFISYRRVSPDWEWVEKKFAPALKRAGLKVFLDSKDFIPGRNIVLEMERAGRASRQAVCVLSPDYFTGNGMAAFEALMIVRSDPSGQDSSLIPFILRSTKIPEWMGGLVSVDWTNPARHSEEWKKLLAVLHAKNLRALPPPPLELFPSDAFEVSEKENSRTPPKVPRLLKFRSFLTSRAGSSVAICVTLLIAFILISTLVKPSWLRWLTEPREARQLPAQPSPLPHIASQFVSPGDVSHAPSALSPDSRESRRAPLRLSVQKIDGKIMEPGMQVPASGTVAGVIEGEVSLGARVFVYVQRRDDGQVWERAGSVPLSGPDWSLENVAFRWPLNKDETKARIQALVGDEELGEGMSDSELARLTKDINISPSSLSVNVPRPEVKIENIELLSLTRRFKVSGTARNLLENEEKLCIFIEATRDAQQLFGKCFNERVSGGRWAVNSSLPDNLKSNDSYDVQVGLVSKEFEGEAKPDGFYVLTRKGGRIR